MKDIHSSLKDADHEQCNLAAKKNLEKGEKNSNFFKVTQDYYLVQ